MPLKSLKEKVELAWEDVALSNYSDITHSVEEVIDRINNGQLRVAEQIAGVWHINEWVKKAILLYFRITKNKEKSCGLFHSYDKINLKKDFEEQKVRVVPGGIARYGAFLAPGVVVMPSFVNIGAYVDENTMIDSYATVGSCAQVGKNVHVSSGVVIGGVLEPVQNSPVIIEDGCFIGSRSVLVEGIRIEKEAVIGAGVTLTASTKIIDVTGTEPKEYKGYIPAHSVVIPGSYTKEFNAGSYQVPCALIIGKRKASTDLKTSLNQALRDFKISV